MKETPQIKSENRIDASDASDVIFLLPTGKMLPRVESKHDKKLLEQHRNYFKINLKNKSKKIQKMPKKQTRREMYGGLNHQ